MDFRSLHIAAATLLVIVLASAGAAAQSKVSGVFKGNDKPATLTQVTAHKGEESGKPVTILVFSSKDQAGDAKPAFDALFGKLGDALVVKVFADGQVYSGDIVHSNLDAPGGSIQTFGVLKIPDYKLADGKISGHLTSNGPHEFHDLKWEIDLTFETGAP
ncbi:MAG TPA: hypothetical protein VJN67_15060 [Stellaceae bacterium]|nr:hypothetical protein [Stellaceae bacterium]